MLTRIATSALPDDEFSRELEANKIRGKVEEFLKGIVGDDDNKVNELMKAPALFAICNTFVLCEYMKNTFDAKGTKFDVYLRMNPDNTITSLIKDDGPGFPESFLNKKPNETMISYFDKKLKSDSGEEKSRIQSTKQTATAPENDVGPDQPKVKGGHGLGLATVARVLDKTAGQFQIGNFADLPADLRSALNTADNISAAAESKNTKGQAVLLVTSPQFAPQMLEKFQNNTSMIAKYSDYVADLSGANDLQLADLDLEESTDTSINSNSHSKGNDSQSLKLNLGGGLGVEDDDAPSIKMLGGTSPQQADVKEQPFEFNPNMDGLRVEDGNANDFGADIENAHPPLGLNLAGLGVEDDNADEIQVTKPLGISLTGVGVEDENASEIQVSNVSNNDAPPARAPLALNLAGVGVEDNNAADIGVMNHGTLQISVDNSAPEIAIDTQVANPDTPQAIPVVGGRQTDVNAASTSLEAKGVELITENNQEQDNTVRPQSP